MIARLLPFADCRGSRLRWTAIAVAIAAATASASEGRAVELQAAAAEDAAAIRMEHISAERIGSGPPVILIPGLSSPRAVWDGVAPELARSRTVYLVQVNGFGSDDPGANLAPGMLAGVVEDLHRLIERQRLKGAAVVGHSMGGLAGLMLARAHPEDVGRLMVVDALPYVGVIFAPGATVAAVEPMAAAMRDRMAAAYGKPRDHAAAAQIAATQAATPAGREQVAKWILAADPRVSARAFYEDAITDFRPAMPSIATPITLVYPWSARLPRERAEAFYRGEYARAPRVRLVDVGDSGHFVMLDQPAAFARALAAFLAD